MPNTFAGLASRTDDVRFVYPGAADYRPPAEVMRGAGGAAADGPSFDALGALEKRGDRYGLAVAQAWRHDRLDAAAQQLRALAPTPPIQADLVAVEILRRTSDDVEPVLAQLEQLRQNGNPAIAHAAQWNHAVLLSRLGLPLSAASEFREVARAGEPGWSDEARKRAATEEATGQEAGRRWKAASEQVDALIATGAPLPSTTVQEFPGFVRFSLYDAVRTAPSPERVRALLPVAAELDRIAHASILSAYVQRVANADFKRRAPLAAAYADLRASKPTAAPEEYDETVYRDTYSLAWTVTLTPAK